MITADQLLKTYDSLRKTEVYDAIEISVIKVMREVCRISVMAKICDGALHIYKLPEFKEIALSSYRRRISRRLANQIEIELQKRSAQREAEEFKTLPGSVVPAIIERELPNRAYWCRCEVQNSLKSVSFYAILPLVHQTSADYFRGAYEIGTILHLFITSVKPITDGKRSRVEITGSRVARELPSKMLMVLTGIPHIKCTYRRPGKISHIKTRERIPKSAINAVGKELKEKLNVLQTTNSGYH